MPSARVARSPAATFCAGGCARCPPPDPPGRGCDDLLVPRIIGGTARGRRLAAPPGSATRPTSDRTREGLFSTLAAMHGPLRGARFLDLFAGSGAVGLEALSRGAAHALLVERDRRAAATIAANIAAVSIGGARARTMSVERLVAASADEPYDVVFLDPPYDFASARLGAILLGLRANGWLRPGALAVVERASRDGALDWPEGYGADRSRPYGEGTLWYARVGPGPGGLSTGAVEEPDAGSTYSSPGT